MKNVNKIFVLIYILFSFCFLISCKEKTEKVISIEINNYDSVQTLTQNHFRLSDIELLITYEDANTKIINLNSSYMTREDCDKFNQLGEHVVYIYFGEANCKYTFTIIEGEMNITDIMFELETSEFVYSGITILPKVNCSNTNLIEDIDYKVEYLNNINAGIGYVHIMGINNYKGEKLLPFTINKKTLLIKANNVEITGNEKPEFTVDYEGFAYLDSKDDLMGSLQIDCIYDESISGEYEIKISGYSSFNYDIVYENGTLTINNKYLDKAVVELEYDSITYNGKENKPDVFLKIDDEYISSLYYEVKYKNNINAGQAKVIINGVGIYYGKIEKEFTINKANLEISINNEEIDYLDLLPNYKITYIGFVSNDNEANLEGKLVIDCSYDEKSVGVYPLTLRGYESNNYNITYRNGFLKVNSSTIDNVKLSYNEITYQASLCEPSVICTKNKSVLELNKDYEVKYEDNLNVGKATVTVTGIGNFKGTITRTFKINKANLTVKVKDKTITYKDEYPVFELDCVGFVSDETMKSLNCSYSFSTVYNVNSNIGEYDVYVTGLELTNYLVSIQKGKLTVLRRELKNEDLDLQNINYTYEGKELYPAVKFNINNITINTDYTISYTNNKNAGTGTVIITGLGNYSGEVVKNFKISKKDLYININSYNIKYRDEIPNITYSINGFVSGEGEKELEGKLVIKCDYTSNSNVGDYPIVFEGYQSNNYNLVYSSAFLKVSPQELKLNNYVKDETKYVYTGKEIQPQVNLSFLDNNLVLGVDFTVEYSNNINAGKGLMLIKGINNFNSQIEDTFTIYPKDIKIKVNNYQINYLDKINDYEYIIEGLPEDFDESELRNAIKVSSNYQIGNLKGNYQAQASGYENSNFNIEYCDGSVEVIYDVEFSGDGSILNPYLITTPSELMGLSSLVCLGNTFENKYLQLVNDLDFQKNTLLVIGDKNNSFKGNFDGNYKKISNYKIGNSKSSYVGLFAYLDKANIKSFGLENINITGNNSSILSVVSGLVNSSVVQNIYINNATIDNNSRVTYGTICGEMINSEIKNCYANAEVLLQGQSVDAGALVGVLNNSSIISSYGNINMEVNVTEGSINGLAKSKNESIMSNVFINGTINVISDSAKVYEISDNAKHTYLDNVLLPNTFIIIQNNLSISTYERISLESTMESFINLSDIEYWTKIDNKYPSLAFEKINNVTYINKPTKLEKVYDGKDYTSYGYNLVNNYKNVGSYTVSLSLKPGYMWSDGTTDDIEIQLEILPKELYIYIDSINIKPGDDYNFTYSYFGLIKGEESILNDFILDSDYVLSTGTYLINYTTLELDNYIIIIREGYLYVSETNDWSIWNGLYEDSTLLGEGTSLNPYLIRSAKDFASLKYKLDNDESTKYYYQLTTNIDLNYHEWTSLSSENSLSPFEGIFDGGGYEIKNLVITKNDRYVGLFGYTKDANITNLRTRNVSIKLQTFNGLNVGVLSAYAINSVFDNIECTGVININVNCNDTIVCGGIVGYQTGNTSLSNFISDINIKLNVLDKQKSNAAINIGSVCGYLQSGSINCGYSIGSIYVNNKTSRTFVGGCAGYTNEGSITNVITYVDITAYVLSGKVDYIIGNNSKCSLNNIICLDTVLVNNNDTLLTIVIGEIKTSEEIETFIDTSFDKYIWDTNDLLYPRLY